jgi:hypothetical protein
MVYALRPMPTQAQVNDPEWKEEYQHLSVEEEVAIARVCMCPGRPHGGAGLVCLEDQILKGDQKHRNGLFSPRRWYQVLSQSRNTW